MRATIIRETNHVVVDGEGYTVDCSDLPADLHVVQWYGTYGEVEYSVLTCEHCNGRSKKMNETIMDFAPYEDYVHRWTAAKAAAEVAREEVEKAHSEANAKAVADAAVVQASAISKAVQEATDANAARSQG